MKNGKSQGTDEVIIEMIKKLDTVGINWTTRILNKCMSVSEIPKEWKTAPVVPI